MFAVLNICMLCLTAKRVIKDGVPVKFSCQKYCHKTTRNIEARNAKPFDVTINFIIQYYVQNKKTEQQMNSFNLHFHYNFLSNDFFMHE